MRVRHLIDFINSKVPFTYFSNEVPSSYTETAAYVRLSGGYPTDADSGKRQPSFQVVIKTKDKSGTEQDLAEDKAWEILDALTNLREVTIGESSITVIRSRSSSPITSPDPETKVYYYGLNFDMVVRP
ncbi:minor capsid protein [Alkalihalobacillus macyae]|uniref:minor capsid protein n=1 Tax=Guptibacillus hwajinpoensis TaxID=208199 RepID=UPI00273B7808|nr:minor capsid protein [Alkalihalobacillus macyae]MDP4549846.1 minor capsid protein [Alkalihalobacillus macyae]